MSIVLKLRKFLRVGNRFWLLLFALALLEFGGLTILVHGSAITAIVLMLLQLILLDIFSIYLIFFYYAFKGDRSPSMFYSDGRTPLIWALRKAYSRFVNTCSPRATPEKVYVADPIYGHRVRPGNYEIELCPNAWTRNDFSYRWTMSIDPDGGRKTCYEKNGNDRHIFLLGCSFMFGWGLNDEHTTAWLLQSYFANQYSVKNLSGPGWCTNEELITIRQLGDSFGPEDFVILGFGGWYKQRNVAAPSWLRVLSAGIRRYSYIGEGLFHARAGLLNSTVSIDFVPRDYCMTTKDNYCNQPDPPKSYMDAVTIELYREILERIRSRVAVLYYGGPDDDPVVEFLRQRKVPIIDGRWWQEKYYVDDDVVGYDAHPGVVKNYSWYTKLRSFIESYTAN